MQTWKGPNETDGALRRVAGGFIDLGLAAFWSRCVLLLDLGMRLELGLADIGIWGWNGES